MGFLEWRPEPGLYSRVPAGVAIKNFCLFSDIRTPSYYGHLRNINSAWQDITDTSGGEAGDRDSLSGWHSDIGIPLHFQEESGIISF